ncbi:MAG: phosphatidylglycerophosphatase A [Pseudomonadota bacterium]
MIGWADRKHGATGIMLDDVFAGFFAAIAVFAIYAGLVFAGVATS